MASVLAHDFFNLAALPALACLAARALLLDREAQLLTLAAASVYLTLDGFFVALWPRCVASPRTILAHHGLTLFALQDCKGRPMGPALFSVGLLVEFNTVLLLARRRLPRRYAWLEFLFYATWLALRLAVPLGTLATVVPDTLASKGTYCSGAGACALVTLMSLQLKWTVDLLGKRFRKTATDDGRL